MQGGNLSVYGVEFLLVFLDKRLRPALDEGQMAQQIHGAIGQSLAVTGNKEPQTEQTEGADGGQQDTHEEMNGLREDVEEYRDKPKPEMAENMSHGVEDDR